MGFLMAFNVLDRLQKLVIMLIFIYAKTAQKEASQLCAMQTSQNEMEFALGSKGIWPIKRILKI